MEIAHTIIGWFALGFLLAMLLCFMLALIFDE